MSKACGRSVSEAENGAKRAENRRELSKTVNGCQKSGELERNGSGSIIVVVVVVDLYCASRSASNALIVPSRCEKMSFQRRS